MPSSSSGRMGLQVSTATRASYPQPRCGFISPYNLYPMMSYQPVIPYNPVMMSYYQAAQAAQTSSQYPVQAQMSAAPAQTGLRFSENALPRPSSSLTTKSSDEPAEPLVRMRFVELSVSGVMEASDSTKLVASLDKLKGSRGATVKRKGGGEATVKVWYSDKEPLDP